MADLTPNQLSLDALKTGTLNLAESTPSQLNVDALNSTTPKLADLLADLPHINWT